jgi:anti-sigma factor RsiW
VQMSQIDRLTATVPGTVPEKQKGRLRAYMDTARTCEKRIQELRRELDEALKAAEEGGSESAERVLALVCELQALEKAQTRVDGWLKQYVAALISEHTPVRFSEAQTYGDGGPT